MSFFSGQDSVAIGKRHEVFTAHRAITKDFALSKFRNCCKSTSVIEKSTANAKFAVFKRKEFDLGCQIGFILSKCLSRLCSNKILKGEPEDNQ